MDQHSQAPELIKQLARDLGGTIKDIQGPLSDGSGFAVVSIPLPADHWSHIPSSTFEPPPMPFRMRGDDPLREQWVAAIRAAGRYAYRASTMQGQELDLDPDALLQNLVVGLLGYWTPDGLSTDAWANPDPVPPLVSDM